MDGTLENEFINQMPGQQQKHNSKSRTNTTLIVLFTRILAFGANEAKIAACQRLTTVKRIRRALIVVVFFSMELMANWSYACMLQAIFLHFLPIVRQNGALSMNIPLHLL